MFSGSSDNSGPFSKNPGAVHPEHGDLTQAMDKHEKAPKGFFLLTAGSTASVALYTSKQPSRLSN